MISFDTYDTIAGDEHRVSIKVQRSEFIGIAFPVDGGESFSRDLVRIQKEFHDATHHCWAWRALDGNEVREQSSDAGEPSGTAGRPILQAIESTSLLDAGVVVVRYYGGVKLGTGGLGRAYRDAAREVLAVVRREKRYLYARCSIEVPYSAISRVYRLVSPPDVVLVAERFGETNTFELDVRRSKLDGLLRDLEEKRITVARISGD
jgi:uncharacterized YigZ family protein